MKCLKGFEKVLIHEVWQYAQKLCNKQEIIPSPNVREPRYATKKREQFV